MRVLAWPRAATGPDDGVARCPEDDRASFCEVNDPQAWSDVECLPYLDDPQPEQAAVGHCDVAS
ncbi:MAG: hypothetical protein ACRBN8_40510 [Nannocystales bacterium]